MILRAIFQDLKSLFLLFWWLEPSIFPSFHKWKQYFDQIVWNPIFCLFFYSTFFFLHQYHNKMAAIFILSLEFSLQFFASCVLVITYMIPFYLWFNRFNSSLRSEYFKLPLESFLLNFGYLLLSFEYKKFIWCYVLHVSEFRMPPTMRRSFCKEFKLKAKRWGKDSLLKTFKQGMPIWKGKVSSHGKRTLH